MTLPAPSRYVVFLLLDAAARARISAESCVNAAVLMSIRSTTLVVLNISSRPGIPPPPPALVSANLASCMAWAIFSGAQLPLIACLATSLMMASSTSAAEPRATALGVDSSPMAALSKSHWGSRLMARPSLDSLPLRVTPWMRMSSGVMPVSRKTLAASMAVPFSSLMFCRAPTTRASADVGASMYWTLMN